MDNSKHVPFVAEQIKVVASHERETQLLEHEAYRKDLENRSLDQDISERKKFAERAFYITKIWVVFLILLTIAQFFLREDQRGLSVLEFNIVFSTTTASVLAFWYLVGKYLFNSKK